MDGDGIDDVDENGVPLDARQQHLQRLVLGRDPTGGDQPDAKKRMKAAYDKHYDDYRRHRVWYQVRGTGASTTPWATGSRWGRPRAQPTGAAPITFLRRFHFFNTIFFTRR